MKMVRYIDDWLNGVTMYALVTYGLSLLVTIGIIFGLTDVVSVSGIGLIASSAAILTAGFITNRLLAYFYKAAINFESSIITCLILILLLPPVATLQRAGMVVLVTIIAIASKYFIAWHHKHVFNPSAIALVVASIFQLLAVTWWIANPTMFPFVLVLGLLVTRKVRCFRLVIVFLLTAIATMLLVNHGGQSIIEIMRAAFMSWPLIFFATIMLTEPATMPPTQDFRLLYGLLVGVIFGAQLEWGQLATTPQLALVAGNLFAFSVSPKFKTHLKLKRVEQITPTVKDFVFAKPKTLNFKPGQYMEWTLPTTLPDLRGNRRTFSLASSPTEDELRIGVKFYNPSSYFKKRLSTLGPSDSIIAGQLAGDFYLPNDPSQKLVFIAGGIGITPFRSMVKYLLDTKLSRDIVLFYCVHDMSETAYRETFESAKKAGIKVVYVVNEGSVPNGGYKGFLSEKILRKELPDLDRRIYYISGPNKMIDTFKYILKKMNISSRNVRTDYFSGY